MGRKFKHRELQSIVIMRILLVAALFLFIVICIEGKATKLKTGGKHKKTLKSATKLKSNAAKEVSPKRRSDKTTKATATEEKAEKTTEEAPVKAQETKETETFEKEKSNKTKVAEDATNETTSEYAKESEKAEKEQKEEGESVHQQRNHQNLLRNQRMKQKKVAPGTLPKAEVNKVTK